MSIRKTLSLTLIAASIALPILIPAVQAQEIIIDRPPPPPREEHWREHMAEHPHEVYAPGHYEWRDGHHVWIDGYWMHERPGYHWEADRWEPRGPRYVFIPGHWVRG
jgi:hypothetical protein